MNISVSVVVPAYNSGTTVARAIDSALNQRDINLEVIVVNDGSTDNTSRVLESYGDSIRVISQNNSGPAASRNAGIKVAKGEFIAFLDSDDEWLPNKLAVQLKLFFRYPKVGLVSSSAECLDTSGNKIVSRPRNLRGSLKNSLIYDNYIVTSSVVVRKELLLQSDTIFRVDLDVAEDWHLWVRLSAITDIIVLPDVLVRYHVHSDSLMRVASAQQFTSAYQKMYSSFLEEPTLHDYVKKNWTKLQSNIKYLLSYHHFELGRFSRARILMIEAILMEPSNLFRKSTVWILFGIPRLRNYLKKLVSD